MEGKNGAKTVRHPIAGIITDINLAVVAELDVGVEEALDEILLAREFIAGTLGFHFKTDHPAVARVIADEKVIVPLRAEARAGVVSQPRRPFADVGSGGQEGIGAVQRLLFPRHFLHPGRFVATADIDRVGEIGEILVAAVPTGIGPLDHVDNAGEVTHVGIVIDRKRGPELVECNFLRVAQAGVHNLEAAAIRFHAEDGTGILIVEVAAVLGFQVVRAVADGKIDPAVRAKNKTIEVMTAEADTDAKALLERLALVGNTIVVDILQ